MSRAAGLWIWIDGVWLCDRGDCSQLGGSIAEYLVATDLDGDSRDEILADYGTLGLWLWNEGSWGQLSASSPD